MRLEPQYIEAYFNESLGHKKNAQDSQINDSFFKIGSMYSLQGDECDDFTMPTRLYKLVGVVSELNGIKVDSVVMKQLSGDRHSMVFSLTKSDCKVLNIKFENGLQVFSKDLSWVHIPSENDKKKKNNDKKYWTIFNPNDLSTYPVDIETKKVKCMCVKLKGFVPNVDGCELINRLNVYTNPNLLNNRYALRYRILTEYITRGAYKVSDNLGNIFIEVSFSSVFGSVGVDTSLLKNLSINDFITVELC